MKFGIDLGGSHIAIGLVNANSDIIEKRTYYMDDRSGDSTTSYIVSSIVHGINEILDSCKMQLKDIEMIGIATPGNPKNGQITNIVNLGLERFDIENDIKNAFGEKSFNIPIKLKNDGKCAALAEKKYGSLKEYKDCIFLCIGTGIGGAAFIDNIFLEPQRNPGFEFGHMVIKKDGEQCNCGNKGCFEVYCSKKRLKENIQKALGIKEYIGAKDLINRIKEHPENIEVKKLIENYIDDLALGISNIINIFEPEAISIGGSMSHYSELIFDKLKDKIYNGVYLFNKGNPPKILAAQEGNEAGIIGATLIN